MITDVEINDVMVRVLSHFFPGAEYRCQAERASAPARGTFRIDYKGRMASPRTLFAIDVEKAGPLRGADARAFLAGVPGLVLEAASAGKSVDAYGSCVSKQDISAGHLDFDDELVARHVTAARRGRARSDLSGVRQVLTLAVKFLRLASEHRYEGAAPEISFIVGGPSPARGRGSRGHVSLDWLADVKAALTLGSGGAAAYRIGIDGTLQGIVPIRASGADLRLPSRLASLAAFCRREGSICVHLDKTPSICVIAGGACRFRYMNGRWGWLSQAHSMPRDVHPAVAGKTLQLAYDLADCGAGAILALVDRVRDRKRILELVDPACVPVLAAGESAAGLEGTVALRARFNRWLTSKRYTIENIPAPFLLNVCHVDGATFINASDGRLLGYGAVVRVSSGSSEQGARTTATKYLASEFGVAIKVSEDKIATLFRRGLRPCRIW